MSYTDVIGATTFYKLLARFDRDLASVVRARGCPGCGGRLHASNYERKPRGGPPDLPDECRLRLGLCCCVEGCRKRRRPPSVLFLDRRVYTGAAIVLVSALAEGATPFRMRVLSRLIGASAPTLARWQRWFRETFPETPIGQLIRARVAGGLDLRQLPQALIERLRGAPELRVVALLRLLAGEHAP